MNNAIKGFRRVLFFILILLVSVVFSQEEQNNYKKAYSKILLDYQKIFNNLNKAVQRCSLEAFPELNYAKLADKIPKNLSRAQLNAAMYLQQKNYQKKCIGVEVAAYFEITNDIFSVLDQHKKTNFNFISKEKEISLKEEINKTLLQLKVREKPFFRFLASYQSIKESDRAILQTMPELNNYLNYVRLVEVYFKGS